MGHGFEQGPRILLNPVSLLNKILFVKRKYKGHFVSKIILTYSVLLIEKNF